MTLQQLLLVLREQPLIVSVQASEGSPVDDVEALLRLAKASVFEGVKILRLEGADRIPSIRKRTGAVTIGLVKQRYEASEVYITPTIREVDELIAAECEVIAVDGTQRARPHGETLHSLVNEIHQHGRLAMADCDSVESAQYAVQCGADLLGTTLAGYTGERLLSSGPDLALVRELVKLGTPVLAEGRFARRWEVESALRIGACGVVVGGAINDPVKTTRVLLPSAKPGKVAAFDIGGTWLRNGEFDASWNLIRREQIALPSDREERLDWMRALVGDAEAVGVSSGGTIDPASGEVWEAKPTIPGHVGSTFAFDVPCFALNDGLASAWGHACHPRFAGRRVATLALGTGVGAGFVSEGKIMMGPFGQYPRLNDISLMGGATVEQVLGGLSLGPDADEGARGKAREALARAADLVRTMWFPDDVVICGSVGLSDWMADDLERQELFRSPFGTDAGLYGAAALALFPGWKSR